MFLTSACYGRRIGDPLRLPAKLPVLTAACPHRDGWNQLSCGAILVLMTDVEQVLAQIEQDDPSAAEPLPPLVKKPQTRGCACLTQSESDRDAVDEQARSNDDEDL